MQAWLLATLLGAHAVAQDAPRVEVPLPAEMAALPPRRMLAELERLEHVQERLAAVGRQFARDHAVQAWADRVWRDARLASRHVRRTARDLGVRLPPRDLDEEALLDDVVAQLSALPPDRFDAAWTDALLVRQAAAIDALVAALLVVEIPELEGLIAKIAPLVRQHHQLGELVAAELPA